MRVVIDTNVLISGLLWRGTAHILLQEMRDGRLGFVSSPALLAEFEEVLARRKFDAVLTRSQVSREALLSKIRILAEVIDPVPLAKPVCRDPDDDMLLALALAAQVDAIVSGDDDVLSLHPFEGIDILSPAAALQKMQQKH